MRFMYIVQCTGYIGLHMYWIGSNNPQHKIRHTWKLLSMSLDQLVITQLLSCQKCPQLWNGPKTLRKSFLHVPISAVVWKVNTTSVNFIPAAGVGGVRTQNGCALSWLVPIGSRQGMHICSVRSRSKFDPRPTSAAGRRRYHVFELSDSDTKILPII